MYIRYTSWLRLELPEDALSKRNNILRKLDGPKLIITGGKTAKEELGCSVSISKESKDMLKQLNDEKKEKDESLSSENKSSTIDLNSFKDRIIIEGGEYIYETNRQLLYGVLHYTDGKYNFGNLRSTYEKLRNEAESLFNDEELEEQLRLLEADYEDVLTKETEHIKTAVKFWAKQGKEEEKMAIKNLFGMDKNEIFDMVGIEKDKSFVDSIDIIIKFLLKNNSPTSEI